MFQILIALVAAILFIPYIGSVHLFDWDEINFAESAREMLITGNYLDVQINYTPFWEKPPLFSWLQAISMKIFGINEFAARLPNAIVGMITPVVLFNIGTYLYNKYIGLMWSLVYVGSLLPFFFFKSGIIDPLFNLFIFLGIYQFYRFSGTHHTKQGYLVFLSALFIGLATLTKGPVALLIFLLTSCIYMVINRKYRQFITIRVVGIFLLTYCFVGGFWFILQLLSGNYSLLVDFVKYMLRLLSQEDSGHGGFFGYHFIVLLLGVFPASIFAIKSMGTGRESTTKQQDFKQWMTILFWVVLILFSIVRTKIVHYSSLCYFPLTFFAVLSISKMLKEKMRFNVWLKVILNFIVILWGGGVIALRYIEENKQMIFDSNLIKDDFALGNLQAEVDWHILIVVVGVLYILFTSYLLWFYKRKQIKLLGIFVLSLLFMELTILFVVPRIEQYTQNSAIEFYKSKINEDCYIDTYGFKSYAHYFYSHMPAHTHKNYKDKQWLLSGQADKTVYIVCKNIVQVQFEKKYPYFENIEVKNGYAFYVYKKG